MKLLLRFYPRAWRQRYGGELEALIEDSVGGNVTWRLRIDLVIGGLRERLRASGLVGDQVPPNERPLAVLVAWVVMTVAGLVVQKTSEQWQQTTGGSTAFDVIKIAAAIGSFLVVVGIAAAVPALVRYLRCGGWEAISGPIVRAGAVTLVTAATAGGLVAWASQLSPAGRNGADLAYSLAFLGCASLIVGCLAMWTIAAIATVRRLHLSAEVIRFQSWISAGVALSMVVITIATLVWWAQTTSVDTAWLIACCTTTMVFSTVLASTGALRAVRGG